MPVIASEHALVSLKGGPAVPLDALQVLWGLEDRGLAVRIDDEGCLLVGPSTSLTNADRQAINQHRDALRALVLYCTEIVA